MKRFELDDSYLPLSDLLNPGFMSIENGTNEKENDQIRKNFRKAKANIRKHFESQSYFEGFVEIFAAE